MSAMRRSGSGVLCAIAERSGAVAMVPGPRRRLGGRGERTGRAGSGEAPSGGRAHGAAAGKCERRRPIDTPARAHTHTHEWCPGASRPHPTLGCGHIRRSVAATSDAGSRPWATRRRSRSRRTRCLRCWWRTRTLSKWRSRRCVPPTSRARRRAPPPTPARSDGRMHVGFLRCEERRPCCAAFLRAAVHPGPHARPKLTHPQAASPLTRGATVRAGTPARRHRTRTAQSW